MSMAKQQWERWLEKALNATARAWSEGRAMPNQASEMFHDFDEAWDLLVRGDSSGAAKLISRYGYSMGAINNQQRLLKMDVAKGYTPPKGSELMKNMIYGYFDEFKAQQEKRKEKAEGDKATIDEIESLLGVRPVLRRPPSSDMNIVVSTSVQPVEIDVLDPALSEDELATLIEWARSGVQRGNSLYYADGKLYLSSQNIRTARRTGWDRD